MVENWKDIKGYEGAYQVSDLGNVKSLDRKVKSRYDGGRKVFGVTLKQGFDKDGYRVVKLKKHQYSDSQRVHRLVCIAFLDNYEDKPQVNHKNGIKDDNVLGNLEWATLSENRIHAYDTGLQNGLSRRGAKSNFAKLSEKQVLEIRAMYGGDLRGLNETGKKGRLTCKEISEKYKITMGGVASIVSKKSWAWL